MVLEISVTKVVIALKKCRHDVITCMLNEALGPTNIAIIAMETSSFETSYPRAFPHFLY